MPAGTSRTEHRTDASGTCIAEADEVYSQAFSGTLRSSADRSPFTFRYARVGNDRVSLRTSELSGSIRGEVPNLTDYVVGWFKTGTGTMRLPSHEHAGTPGTPFLLPTERGFRLEFLAHRQHLIHFGPVPCSTCRARGLGIVPLGGIYRRGGVCHGSKKTPRATRCR
jgi:hypothetical protein